MKNDTCLKFARRQEILKDLGFNFKIIPADIDETSDKDLLVDKIQDIAYKKAYHIAKKNEKEFVLAADTIVEKDSEVLGKPKNKEDVIKYLKKLSNTSHRVITAYALINIEKNIHITDVDISEVKFYEISDEEINWYIDTGEPFDKAGAYGIQGQGRIFIERINGDFFSIMGFPIAKFMKELKKLKYEIKDISKI